MAANDINQSTRVFQAGGVLTIDDGTDVHTVFNLEPGSLSWTDPTPKRLEFTDRGPVQTPLELDDQYGTLDVTVRCGTYVNGIIAKMRGRNATANTPRTFSVVIKIPNYRGAAAGESLTWAAGKVFLRESVEWKAGGETSHDTATFKFGTLNGPTIAGY